MTIQEQILNDFTADLIRNMQEKKQEEKKESSWTQEEMDSAISEYCPICLQHRSDEGNQQWIANYGFCLHCDHTQSDALFEQQLEQNEDDF